MVIELSISVRMFLLSYTLITFCANMLTPLYLFQEEYDPKKMDFKKLRQQDLDGQLRSEKEAVSLKS